MVNRCARAATFANYSTHSGPQSNPASGSGGHGYRGQLKKSSIFSGVARMRGPGPADNGPPGRAQGLAGRFSRAGIQSGLTAYLPLPSSMMARAPNR